MRAIPILIPLFCLFTLPLSAADPAHDARLTDYEYPYSVSTISIHSQQQNLEMAYMDVRPAQPNGKTVLLLHGKNFSGAYWASTIDALSREGFRVIAPDQIGFGKSSKPRHFQFTFHALSSHTQTLVDRLGIEKVSVVGHSMGGMLAVRFALMFPEKVEKLALVNPIGLEDWKRVVPYMTVEANFESELKKEPDDIKKYMRENYFHGQWRPAYDPLLEIQQGWLNGPDRRLMAWISALTSDMIFTQPVLYEFPDLKMPTLLIIGQRDRTALGKNAVPPEIAETLGNYCKLGRQAAQSIPNATLVELENTGHVPQYESFEEYIQPLSNFLADEF